MDLNLKGKSVIITGSGQGIGRAIALSFAREGANVAVADINDETAEKTASDVRALGVKSVAIHTDVSDYGSACQMVAKAVDEFGKVDVLVNNAAIFEGNYFVQGDPTKWQKLVNVCFMGVLNCTRAALEHMVPNKSGVIVSMSSDAGRSGEPREAVYSGAKAAIIGFSKAIAKEEGRNNIRVNVVCPAMTKSRDGLETMLGDRLERVLRLYPLRRLGDPQDQANAVLFLASDAASWITGQTLSVDGGFSI